MRRWIALRLPLNLAPRFTTIIVSAEAVSVPYHLMKILYSRHRCSPTSDHNQSVGTPRKFPVVPTIKHCTDFTIQSPPSHYRLHRIYVSWDPETCTTSSYLVLEGDCDSNGFRRQIMSTIRQLGGQARFPLALVLLILASNMQNLLHSYRKAYDLANAVERSLGLSGPHRNRFDIQHLSLDHASAHSDLIHVFQCCAHIKSPFIHSIVEYLKPCFAGMDIWVRRSGKDFLQSDLSQLQDEYENIYSRLSLLRGHAATVEARADVHMRVVRSFLNNPEVLRLTANGCSCITLCNREILRSVDQSPRQAYVIAPR